MRYNIVILTVISFIFSYNASAQIITTIAGNGTVGFSGDRAPATACEMSSPFIARPDKSGNIYIADVLNRRVRKINTAGIISTVAGHGPTHSGDGGPATSAGFYDIMSVAIDTAGVLYIAEESHDTDGPWLRKVDAAGIISTIAGSHPGHSGDGGPATAATFGDITDVVADNKGNLYVCDVFTNTVRRIDAAGTITTIAGHTSLPGSYSGDGGPATAASLRGPESLAVDTLGDIFIFDAENFRVRKVDNSGTITTVAGNGSNGFSGDGGPATAAELGNAASPDFIAADNEGNIYIADVINYRIRKVSTAGIMSTIAGNGTAGNTGDGGPATAAEFRFPSGVSIDAPGNIYITDGASNVVRKVTPDRSGISIPGSNYNGNDLKIWPEPNKGVFNVFVRSNSKDVAQVVITNLLGQPIEVLTVNTNREEEIRLNLPPGIFFVTALTDRERLNARVEIQ